MLIQLATAYLPRITVTYISLISSSFHNLSGLHFHTKGCSPPCVPVHRIIPRALCSYSLCGFRGWRSNLSLISCFEPETCGHTVLSVSFVPLLHFCLFKISTFECSDSRSGTFRPSGCECKWSCSLMRRHMWINRNQSWQMTCARMGGRHSDRDTGGGRMFICWHRMILWYRLSAGMISFCQSTSGRVNALLPKIISANQAAREHTRMLIAVMISCEKAAVFDLHVQRRRQNILYKCRNWVKHRSVTLFVSKYRNIELESWTWISIFSWWMRTASSFNNDLVLAQVKSEWLLQ